MRMFAAALLLATPGIGVAATPSTAPVDAIFKAGAVRTDITPSDLAGLNPMTGRAFDRVHDPIYARILVLQRGGESVALVTLDLIEAGDMTAFRQRIARETGIAADHVMITATHDHNAPRLGDVTPGALAHPGGAESRVYSEWVYGRIIAAIRSAQAAARPARYGVGQGSVDVNVNRDQFTGSGWRIGFNPDGPSDKTLRVVRFDGDDGKPIAVLFNYPVHANVMLGINELSGDLAGAAERHIEAQLGGDAVALFTQSAIGDQAPRVFKGGQGKSPGDTDTAWRAADAQGLMVGAEVVRVASGITDIKAATRLAAAERVVPCPVKQGINQMADMKQAQVTSVPLRLSLIRFDDVALGGVSGEVVTNIERHLQAVSPLRNTLLVSLANDRIGYLPDDAAYDRPIFEVNGSPVARGCAESAIVNGLSEMIVEAGR